MRKTAIRHLVVFAALLLCFLGQMAQAAKPVEALGKTADYDPKHPPSELKVLVGLGTSTFFYQDGRPHGVEYAMLLDLEKFLNRDVKKGQQAVHVQFIPVERSQLLPELLAGKGDIAAGLIPVTSVTRDLLLFTRSYVEDQWCVAGSGSELPSVTSLAERPLTVPTGLAGWLLTQVNEQRQLRGEAPIQSEDYVHGSQEMLMATLAKNDQQVGLLSRYQLGLWSKRFPNIKMGECLASNVSLAWAVRKDQPQLHAVLDQFLATTPNAAQKALQLTQKFLPADGRIPVETPPGPSEQAGNKAPDGLVGLFQTAGKLNSVDWLLLAAIAQRETGMQHVVSPKGPTGIMQLAPTTAIKMGAKDPHDLTQNILAGARYVSYLRKMFQRPEIAAEDQFMFVLAAYNAGEGRVSQLRRMASAQGLDPNRWQGHVEQVSRQVVGSRLGNYVSAVTGFYRKNQAAAPVLRSVTGSLLATADALSGAPPVKPVIDVLDKIVDQAPPASVASTVATAQP